MVAFEISHYLKRKKQGKVGMAALKLYMSKAYDRVDWPFIEHMLIKLGFFGRFIRLIMMCVSLASYKVWSNGLEIGPIIPQRGLRQGDSISP